jgi:hypothetical protein
VDLVRSFKDISRDSVHVLGLYQLLNPGPGVGGVVLTSLIPNVKVILIVLQDNL